MMLKLRMWLVDSVGWLMCGDKFSFLDEVERGAACEDADAGRPHTGESRDRVRQPPGSERDVSKYSGMDTLRPSSP